MNLRDLRYLIAVAEHRHFGRAAEACHVSQPTLSGQIRKLEEELGVILFERTSRLVVPTPLAESMLVHARASVEQADALRELARAGRDPYAGRFRLGVIPTLAPYVMPWLLPALQRSLPALQPAVWEDVTDSLIARLRRHELDGILIANPPEGEDLTATLVFEEPFLAALPAGHALAARATLSEQDLLGTDLLLLAEGHCLRDQALALCGTAPADGADLRATSLETLLNLVTAGMGSTLVPALAVRQLARERGGLALRPMEGGRASRGIRLTGRTGYPRQALLDRLAALLAAEVPSDSGCRPAIPAPRVHA